MILGLPAALPSLNFVEYVRYTWVQRHLPISVCVLSLSLGRDNIISHAQYEFGKREQIYTTQGVL